MSTSLNTSATAAADRRAAALAAAAARRQPTAAAPTAAAPTAAAADLQAMIDKLKAENQALKTAQAKPLTIRRSEKGAVSVYGLGKFPVTLYAEQWPKVLDMAEDIRQFIENNKAVLSWKH